MNIVYIEEYFIYYCNHHSNKSISSYHDGQVKISSAKVVNSRLSLVVVEVKKMRKATEKVWTR